MRLCRSCALVLGLLPLSARAQHVASASPSLLERTWQIVDSGYVASGFDRRRWALARPRTPAPGTTDAADPYMAVRGLLRQLDDPAVGLVAPTERTAIIAQLTGQQYVGIGLVALLSLDVNERDGHLVVVTPTPGTPATQAGVRTGDEVIAIDDIATDTVDLISVVSRFQAPVGAPVTLRIRRDGRDQQVTLVRQTIGPLAHVVSDTVLSTAAAGRIAYVALRQFTPGADSMLRAALGRIARQRVAGILLDLRDNPGGDLDACRGIGGLFLGPRPFARRVGRGGQVRMLYATGQQTTTAPLVVLVNRGTASAAEVLAGSLRAAGRAILVGQRTFGKAMVHTLAPLDGQASILLSVARLQTQSGQEILRVGLTPDVVVHAPSPAPPPPFGSVPDFTRDTTLVAALRALVARQPVH